MTETNNKTYRHITLPAYTPDLKWVSLVTQIIKASCEENDALRFLNLYQALPEDMQTQYVGLLNATDNENDRYETLLARIKQKLQPSNEDKLNALLDIEPLGDRSPRQMYDDIQRRFESIGQTDKGMMRALLIRSLPESYADCIYNQTIDNLEEAVDSATYKWKVKRQAELRHSFMNVLTSDVAQIEANASRSASASLARGNDKINVAADVTSRLEQTLNEFTKNVQKLSDQITKIDKNCSRVDSSDVANAKPSEQYYQPPHKRSRCPELPNANNPQGLCFYHGTFGFRARNCAARQGKPCSWNEFTIPRHDCTNNCPWNKYKKTEFLNERRVV